MIRLYLMCGAALIAMGAAADRFMPVIGANAQIERVKVSRDTWAANAREWTRYGKAEKAAFDESERLRGVERARGLAALNEAGAACSARVARARASAAAIRAIVEREPQREPNGCAVRALIDPRELRDALDPARR